MKLVTDHEVRYRPERALYVVHPDMESYAAGLKDKIVERFMLTWSLEKV